MITIELSEDFKENHLYHKYYFDIVGNGPYIVDQDTIKRRMGDAFDSSKRGINAAYACYHYYASDLGGSENIWTEKMGCNPRKWITNMKSENLNHMIHNYESYIKYCFRNNLPVAIRADLFYFDIIWEIMLTVGGSHNKNEFMSLYNGSEDGQKIRMDYEYCLKYGFHPLKFTEYIQERIENNVNFDASILTDMAFDESSKMAFTILSMYGGKEYFKYYATGMCGSQGPYVPEDYRVKGFKSIHILDDIKQYSKLLDNMSRLDSIFGKYNSLKHIIHGKSKFVQELHTAIMDPHSIESKEFLANLPLKTSSFISEHVVVDLAMGEFHVEDERPDERYRKHKIATGLYSTELSSDVEDLHIPTYDFIIWEDVAASAKKEDAVLQ